jgi:protein-tyrosine-phosphatase
MHTAKRIILFVCTDNIGRSLIAEYLLRDYLQRKDIAGFDVRSAGIDATNDIRNFDMRHLQELQNRSIDCSGHVRTQLTKDMAMEADIVIAMDVSHQQWVAERCGVQAHLFNEIGRGESTSVNIAAIGMEKIVAYIDESIPAVAEYCMRFGR